MAAARYGPELDYPSARALFYFALRSIRAYEKSDRQDDADDDDENPQ
jgi:hypothetical protein